MAKGVLASCIWKPLLVLFFISKHAVRKFSYFKTPFSWWKQMVEIRNEHTFQLLLNLLCRDHWFRQNAHLMYFVEKITLQSVDQYNSRELSQRYPVDIRVKWTNICRISCRPYVMSYYNKITCNDSEANLRKKKMTMKLQRNLSKWSTSVRIRVIIDPPHPLVCHKNN
jgi:hypothetical protein